MIYTVSQLNQEVKELLDAVPGYRELLIRGEISNCKAHTSGHWYLTLKDADASIPAVLFRSNALRLKFHPANGLKVVVRARVSSFPRTGQVQLILSDILPGGAGVLHVAFEQCKAKLSAEGLFAEEHKKPLPAYPKRLALVTSPTGAAVQDMLRILARRWPVAAVTVYPTLVQGDAAPASICRALALVNAIGGADVILCGRGGGTLENLWAFNTEEVARAIFASAIPVISAVGHEPDVTIADYVADLRAPTPSGAAELAVPDRADLLRSIQQNRTRLLAILRQRLAAQRQQRETLQRRLQRCTPLRYLTERRRLLDEMTARAQRALQARLHAERGKVQTYQQRGCAAYHAFVHQRRIQWGHSSALLDAVSPLRVLTRGYAIATDAAGAVVTQAAALQPGDRLRLRLAQGRVDCQVVERVADAPTQGGSQSPPIARRTPGRNLP